MDPSPEEVLSPARRNGATPEVVVPLTYRRTDEGNLQRAREDGSLEWLLLQAAMGLGQGGRARVVFELTVE